MERGEHSSNNLTPEPWVSLGEHQMHPALAEHYQNSLGCSVRDSTSERQPPFFSHGVSNSRLQEGVHVVNSSMLQQFGAAHGHSSRPHVTPNSHSAPQPVSDRSAWTHLLSLDPSLTSYTSQSSNPHQVSSYGHHPLFEMSSVERSIPNNPLGRHLDLVNDPLPLTSMSVPLSQHSSVYSAAVSTNALHHRHQRSAAASLGRQGQGAVPQHLNQLMNLSRDVAANFARVPTSSISDQPVDLLEPGGYSPVSPPSHDTDPPPPSSYSGSRVAELLKTDTPSSANLSLSSNDNFSYMPDKQPSPFLKIPTSSQPINADFRDSSFSHTLNVPLDMTKVFPSKNEAQDMTLSKKSNQISVPVMDNVFMENSGMDFDLKGSSGVERIVKEAMPPPDRPSSDTFSSMQMASSDRALKPVVKSTPKKSNFYGRDASLFSFSNEPSSQSQSSVVHNSDRLHQPVALSNSTGSVLTDPSSNTPRLGEADKSLMSELPSSSLESLDDINSAQSRISPDCDSSGSNFADSFIEASTRDCPPVNVSGALNSGTLPTSIVITENSDASGKVPIEVKMPKCSVDLTNIVNVETGRLMGSVTVNSLLQKTSHGTSVVPPNAADVSQNDAVMSPGDVQAMELGIEGPAQSDDSSNTIPDDSSTIYPGDPSSAISDESMTIIPTVPLATKPTVKRRKRKGSSFQPRQRKRPKKTQVAVPNFTLVDNMGVGSILPPPGADGDVSLVTPKPPVRRRRRKAAASQVEGDEAADSAPRRSSSRKSKANAMRLIELQADSNYGFTSPIISEEAPPPLVPPTQEKKRGKRAKKSIDIKEVEENPDLDSLSSDEPSEREQDAEYAPDEEDLQGDLSPAEEENNKVKELKSKRVGGLKISIKLGSENLAQIVTGIRKQPTLKKRKSAPKKVGKTKFKSQEIIEDDDEEDEDKSTKKEEASSDRVASNQPEPEVSTETASVKQEPEEKLSPEDKEKLLLDNYFNAATKAVKKTISTGTGKALNKAVPARKKKMSKVLASKTAKSNVKIENAGPGTLVKSQTAGGNSENTVINIKGAGQNNGNGSGELAKFVCGYCPQRYHSKDDLMVHMEAHMAEMESKGENNNTKEDKKPVAVLPSAKKNKVQIISEKSVAKPPSLAGPAKVEKKAAPAPEHKCGECGLVFPSKATLLDHVGMHTADKPFECNLCHKCFKDRELLSAHRKTHNQEDLVRCPICSKGFIHEPDLVRHIRTHPKRSTPQVPLKRTMAPQKNSITVKTSSVQSKEQSRAKPTSFASALSGEFGCPSAKVTKTPTIVLKRGENQDSTSKPPKLSAPPTPLSHPFSKSTKSVPETAASVQTHSSTPSTANNVVKQGEGASGKDVSGKKLDVKTAIKPSTTSTPDPGHCTCKECPECVTRFLQSFY